MKKIELLVLATSIGLTTIISIIAGFAGSTIIGSFWGWFWIVFLLQVIGFLAWNSYLLQAQQIANDKIEAEMLEQLSKFTIALNCAYCQAPNQLGIQLDQKNTFTCLSCNQANGVFMQFQATPLTTPIDSIKLPIPDSDEKVTIS